MYSKPCGHGDDEQKKEAMPEQLHGIVLSGGGLAGGLGVFAFFGELQAPPYEYSLGRFGKPCVIAVMHGGRAWGL